MTEKEVLLSAIDLYLDKQLSIDEEGEDEWENYEFSQKFERKMKKLIGQMRNGTYSRLTVAVRNVLIAAALMALLCATAYAFEPIRNRIDNFFVEMFEKYSEVDYVADNASGAPDLSKIKLGYIPEGFHLVSDKSKPTYRKIIYQDDNSAKLFCSFWIEGSTGHFDSEHSEMDFIEINNDKYYFRNTSDQYCYLWEHNGIRCQLICDVPTEEFKKIISGILY